MSVEDIVEKYHGFEGESIDFLPMEINPLELEEIWKKNCQKPGFSILIVLPSNGDLNFLENKASFLGYDYGICEEDKSIYSSIFNEILFGNILELISYKDRLNESFLFPSAPLTEKFVQLHHELLLKGKDVEADEDMKIFGIWKYLIHKN